MTKAARNKEWVTMLAKLRAAEHFIAGSPRITGGLAKLAYGHVRDARSVVERLVKAGLVRKSVGPGGPFVCTEDGIRLLDSALSENQP